MAKTGRTRSGRKASKSGGGSAGVSGRGLRWIVSLSALGVAILAIYVLVKGGGGHSTSIAPGEPAQQRALDDIDAKSREAMRELLRDAGD